MRPKILISYFYQIRFFKPNYIPISTAFFDPKYYHQGCGKNYQFTDKNGVINGIRAEVFMPGEECEGLCHGPQNCQYKDRTLRCEFLKTYKKQLEKLNFEDCLERFTTLGNRVKDYLKFEEEPILVLIVYETPNNPCSERWPLIEWFRENGYELEEFNKENI